MPIGFNRHYSTGEWQKSLFGAGLSKEHQRHKRIRSDLFGRSITFEGAEIVVYDPKVSLARMQMDLQTYWSTAEKQKKRSTESYKAYSVDSAEAACTKAHAFTVITEWDVFQTQDFEIIFNQMEKPAFVFDGRKILNHNQLQSIGFTTYEIGKASED